MQRLEEQIARQEAVLAKIEASINKGALQNDAGEDIFKLHHDQKEAVSKLLNEWEAAQEALDQFQLQQ